MTHLKNWAFALTLLLAALVSAAPSAHALDLGFDFNFCRNCGYSPYFNGHDFWSRDVMIRRYFYNRAVMSGIADDMATLKDWKSGATHMTHISGYDVNYTVSAKDTVKRYSGTIRKFYVSITVYDNRGQSHGVGVSGIATNNGGSFWSISAER